MRLKSFDIVPHGTKFDFVGKRHIAVTLSLIANLAVIVWCLPFVHGLNYGVDFAGGTEMEVRFGAAVDPGDVRAAVEHAGFKGASVQTYGAAGVSDDTVLSRLFAVTRALQIADGPTEVHLRTVARLELAAYQEASA